MKISVTLSKPVTISEKTYSALDLEIGEPLDGDIEEFEEARHAGASDVRAMVHMIAHHVSLPVEVIRALPTKILNQVSEAFAPFMNETATPTGT